ncbi:MAG: MFS transporter [Phycisphaerales bacterium]|nr:MFS transporter [Phycisphaerales bacterium]
MSMPPCDLTCEYPAGRFRAWLFWALPAAFFLYEFMLRVSPSVVESALQNEFHADGSQFGFTMGLYYYAYAPMQLVVGLLLDRYGSRRPLAVACFICAAGAALFASAWSLGWLGGGRFLAGFGSAFAYVGTIYVASVWFPTCRIALLAGVTAALGMVGAVLGEMVLGGLGDAISWRTTAWAFAATGVILGLLIWAIVPNRPAWFEASILKSRAESGSGVFAGLKCVLRSRQTWCLSIVAGLLYLPVGTFGALWGDRYLCECLEMTAHQASTGDAILFVGLGISAPLLGWWSDRSGRRKTTLVIGILLALLSTAGLLLLTSESSDLAYGLLFGMGFGVGAIVVAFPMGMDLNPHHARGAAITFINFFQMLLAGAGQWGIGVLLDFGQGDSMSSYSITDYRTAFTVLPISLVLALGLVLLMRDQPCRG